MEVRDLLPEEAEPRDHLIQFYGRDHQLLIGNVGRFFRVGLRRGEGLLAIASLEHCDAFARELASAVAASAPALDTRISAVSDGWPAERLGTLERNVLRIGVYELEEETVPADVAINEAIVLAKRYATEDAARLVNGILGRIARERQ